jgi:DNA-directed RNA polymerase sigma subunit (sigma70/sigma32)
VSRALAVLGRRERRVIERRFFDGRMLGEVGRELGVSGERARQVQGRALGRLAELCPGLEDHIT